MRQNPAITTSRKSKASLAAWRVIGKALGALLIWLAGPLLAVWCGLSLLTMALAVTALWIIFMAFTLYFFRDPTPNVPSAGDVVVAPAHGLVDCVEESREPQFLGGRCWRLSIFLSVLDVHVQNAPVAGQVIFLRHERGSFLSALKTESAVLNENLLVGIKSSERPGELVAVRQIAGVLARRIESWVNPGDMVARGQRLGIIYYGSRCDLYLPLNVKITVKPGARVVGGQTVVARRAPFELELEGLPSLAPSQSLKQP
jgi:phosphatidylserine decarboxylase